SDTMALGEPTGVAAPFGGVGFLAINDGKDHWFCTSQGMKIGRWLHCALATSHWDIKIFAANDKGELFCRDGHLGPELAIDLVWRKIGIVPQGTFALAAEGGRIFALAGTPGKATLSWRWARAAPGFREPGVLLV